MNTTSKQIPLFPNAICPVAPECETHERLINLETAVNVMSERLTKVETIGQDVTSIMTTLEVVAKRLRFWAPSIVAAAISAGIVNGKLGAFLHALLNGAN